jgi:hypothetical protein
MQSVCNFEVDGHVLIKDKNTGEVLMDKENAVHSANMAKIIARALAHEANGWIFKISLGNGGTYFNSSNQIVYKTPNVTGVASLYNQTYEEQVDDNSTGGPPPAGNSVYSQPSPAPLTTYQVVSVLELDATEPSGQAPDDASTPDPESLYTFDEIALKSEDNLLLTHLIHSPIEKTANRAITITYTLTISVS